MSKGEKPVMDVLIQTGSFAGVTKGHQVIERFCNAVENDETPDKADLKMLAEALQHLRFKSQKDMDSDNARRDALAGFSNALGLTKKQGRQESNFLEACRMAGPSITFLLEQQRLIEEGNTPSYARQKARQITIEKEAESTGQEMTISAFDKRHKKWREFAETQIAMLKLAESIIGNITGK